MNWKIFSSSLFFINFEKNLLKILLRIWFVSTNDEYLKAIEYLGEKYEKQGIYALDRGFDDKK